ncbi:methyl-accepting chemotaxis protein [Alkaliphilus pronyensis]|uniref:Methyl-accepting chemotaxis protein n=1 Tax=Alkaliphilus pronyensis TaxID=1482732 RepID=A0A6I0F168_9FIRM|nr:HAMP domain-containing methyl-accepting chemotaxis protein [Alkaliphilus pronyensis]KAB3536078.1 methyl-accepting chemotaxis protein [Alkaliphilus pronyensis]
MQLKFKTKLFLLVFVLIVATSGWLTYQNLESTEEMFKEEMKEIGFTLAASVDDKIKTAKKFEKVLDDLMAERILQACEAIDLLDIESMSNEQLIDLAPKLKVDGGIYVIGPDRKIIYSDVVDYVGWEYKAGHAMDPVFNGKQKTYMEQIRGDLISGEMNKYGGIALSTDGYYVQIGVKAKSIMELQRDFSLDNLLAEIEAHNDVIYALMLDTQGIAYAGTESMLSDEPCTVEVTVNATQKGIAGAAYWEDEGIRAYDVQIPYFEGEELKGSICVGITLDRMDEMLAKNASSSFTITAITCIISIIIMIFAISLLLKPLNKLSLQLSDISKGDFTIEQDPKLLKQKDELGLIANSVQAMRKELSTLVTALKKDAKGVEDGAHQLHKIMNETSRAIEENARAVEALAISASDQSNETDKVARSVEMLGEKVDQGQASIKNVNQRVLSVNNLSTDGETIVTDLAKVTKESIGRTDAVSEGIKKVEETVNNMSEFMGRIRSISEQTNLLALNASIEAARAGEAGRGFAVVANEIRKLAEETNQTTAEVETIIEEITTKTKSAAEDISAIGEVTSQQRETLQKTLDIFGRIQDSIVELVEAMDVVIEVNEAVGENKDTIKGAIGVLAELTENLSATFEEISASTEEQTASVEEINALTETNKNVAKKLADRVNHFKTIE